MDVLERDAYSSYSLFYISQETVAFSAPHLELWFQLLAYSHLWLPHIDLVTAQHLLSLARNWDGPGGGITIVIPIGAGCT